MHSSQAQDDCGTRAEVTEREREVMRLASLGYANKRIAYDLGVRESTVATWLGRGLRKIGGVDRSRAITVLSDVRIDAFDDTELTSAELEVLSLLIEGASNADIARRRGRSIKTIANQVRAVYQKVGVGCRRELWAKRPCHTMLERTEERPS